jgi:hypothetical protein
MMRKKDLYSDFPFVFVLMLGWVTCPSHTQLTSKERKKEANLFLHAKELIRILFLVGNGAIWTSDWARCLHVDMQFPEQTATCMSYMCSLARWLPIFVIESAQ